MQSNPPYPGGPNNQPNHHQPTSLYLSAPSYPVIPPYPPVEPPRKRDISFMSLAIVTLILYSFLWVPGVVCNGICLSLAHRERKRLGVKPDGYGCLFMMLMLFVALPIGGGLLCTLATFGLHSLHFLIPDVHIHIFD